MPAVDDVNQNIVNQFKYNSAASGVNQNSCGVVVGGGASIKAAPNINNNSSSSLNNNNNNNHLVNSNISVSFNRTGAADVSTVPCGVVNLNNNINNISNRTLDYNNYYETNNNATGESKYGLANGHKNSEEVSV